jgi:flavorubredoxin
MARSIADGIASQGVDVKILKLRSYAISEAMTELLDAKTVLVGSPTLNNGMFPTVSSFLTYAA